MLLARTLRVWLRWLLISGLDGAGGTHVPAWGGPCSGAGGRGAKRKDRQPTVLRIPWIVLDVRHARSMRENANDLGPGQTVLFEFTPRSARSFIGEVPIVARHLSGERPCVRVSVELD